MEKRYKRKFRIIIIIFMFVICVHTVILATEGEILDSQAKSLNIPGFIEEANKYTKNIFDGMEMDEVLNAAIKGEINNETLFSNILNLFGKEIRNTISTIRNDFNYNCYT